MDADDFSRRSRRYRMSYLDNVKSLYGDAVIKTQYKTKVGRSKGVGREDALQINLVTWMKIEGLLVMSIPNHGKRSLFDGQKQKKMGLFPGAADLFLLKSNKKYNGMFIELKSPGEKPRQNQLEFGELVKQNGYWWDWFDDFDTARSSILSYIQLP